MTRVAYAPDAPPKDTRPFEQISKEFADQHVMGPDETLDGLLRAFEAQNATSLRLVETADLDAAVPVPRDIPWFPKDQRAWSVRWVILHVINELARHAGHADIVRETIDGATIRADRRARRLGDRGVGAAVARRGPAPVEIGTCQHRFGRLLE